MSEPRAIIGAGGIMRTSIILVSLSVILLLLGTPGFGQSADSCGCSTGESIRSGETVKMQLTVGDTPRSYLLYVPKGYNPGDAIPLIVAFHGWTDTASGMSRGSGLTKTADAYDFAVAFPEGINYPEAGADGPFPDAMPRLKLVKPMSSVEKPSAKSETAMTATPQLVQRKFPSISAPSRLIILETT